jgi:hypothetical protein
MTTTVAPFPTDPHLTSIAIAYRNPRMIADQVLPRVTVSRQEFKYQTQALAQGFTIPDTRVGRKSQVNQVEFASDDVTASTQDYALDAPVPIADIENAPAGYDPLGRATEQTTNLLELDREVRCSQAVFNAANYGAGNKTTLSGSGQWSDPSSSPIVVLTNALDSMVMRANIMVLGRAPATALRRHPKVVKAYNGTTGDEGLVPLGFLQELLELEAIYIGESRLNIARPGQATNLQRAWGNHCALIYRDSLADANSGVTFGFTAQWGARIAAKRFDANIGMRGGQIVRVGESLKEVITAPDLGYFFENAVA